MDVGPYCSYVCLSVDCSGGNINIYITDQGCFEGYSFDIIRVDNSTNTLTLTPKTYTIKNGQTSLSVAHNQSVCLIFNGGDWNAPVYTFI